MLFFDRPRALKTWSISLRAPVGLTQVISLRTLRSGGSSTTQVRGTYALSILLQELAMARELGHKRIILDEGILRENPVDRLSRLVREMFWDGLRRTVDEEGAHRAVY